MPKFKIPIIFSSTSIEDYARFINNIEVEKANGVKHGRINPSIQTQFTQTGQPIIIFNCIYEKIVDESEYKSFLFKEKLSIKK